MFVQLHIGFVCRRDDNKHDVYNTGFIEGRRKCNMSKISHIYKTETISNILTTLSDMYTCNTNVNVILNRKVHTLKYCIPLVNHAKHIHL